MKNFMKQVSETKYETNEKGALKQNIRNGLKADIVKAFSEFLCEQGYETSQTKEGLVIEFTNVELGSIPVVIGFTMKDLQYDVLGAVQDFQKSLAEKAEKLAEKERKRLQNLAEKAKIKEKTTKK